MAAIRDNLQAIRARIDHAVASAGRRAGSVRLLAVSKTHPPSKIEEAWSAGQRAFGESYVQEALEKMDVVARTWGAREAPEWHLVGPLQSNKTRLAAPRFDWVHSLSNERIARRLSEQRPADLPPLQVLIQVNCSGEASKSGVAPQDASALARQVDHLPRLKLRGLMAIPEPTADVAVQRARFRAMRELFESLRRDGIALDTLSIGMSDDFEAAIAEGSTLVRIGTAIFGERGAQRSAA
ncbi:MAG TPA: YggS family pyridoxal phosphate-dependent enzyme [Burkholderiales bacterium]|nr:YggS family pyridoxal phosphate-dependent enzyme [Burkholderiales bacterium]